MQTSPVMNPIVPAQAQATKANDAGAPSDSPNSFNQVLSREMADRKPVNEAPKAKEPEAKAGAKPAGSGNTQDAKAKAAEDTDTSTVADADNTADVQNDAAAATNDMLALVASLSQANPAAQTAAQAAAATTGQSKEQESADIGIDTVASKAKPVVEGAGAARGLPTLDRTAAPASQVKTPVAPATLATAARIQPEQAAGKTDAAQGFAGALDQAKAQAADARDATEMKKPLDVSATSVKPGQEFAAANKESIAAVAAKAEHLADTSEIPAAPAATLQVPQQVAVNNLTHLAASQASETLGPRVGTPAWDQALGQKVTWMIAGEQQSASLTLNPPDLGPLQVVLNVTNSQANATFVAAQPEVRQALEAAMPRLRDMLSDAGIQLGQATVSSGSSGQQSAFDQQQSSSGARRMDVSSVRFDTPVQAGRVQPSSTGQGLVDTFV